MGYNYKKQLSTVLQIHDISMWIRIWIRDLCLWLMDPDPGPMRILLFSSLTFKQGFGSALI
jgi:hypothetical protein